MVKLLAIAVSGALHISLVAGLIAGAGNLREGRTVAVNLVVAVPAGMPAGAGETAAASPAQPQGEPAGEPGLPKPHSAAAPGAYDVPSKVLPPPETAAPPVSAPILTPARAPRPGGAPAAPVVRTAAAAPASGPAAADAAPVAGEQQMPASGGSDGAPAPSTPAVLLASVAPDYPAEARRAGQEGRVVVKAFIGVAGTVERTAIEVSSGFAALDMAAASAVSSYRFRPELRNGTAVASTALVPIRFSLTGSGQ